MSGIFISYRREDSAAIAHALYRELSARFGAGSVFIDVEDIGLGEDFAATIDEKVGFCDALVAVIGPQWLTAAGADGRPRLDDPHDWVRLEIASALSRDIKVFPVLVDGARLPDQRDLPPALGALTQSQALELATDRVEHGMARLAGALEAVGKRASGANLWFSLILRRHKALDPLDLHKPEVMWQALRFMLYMMLIDALLHLPAAAGTGTAAAKLWYLLAYSTANYVQYLGAGLILHFAMRAFGGKARLPSSIAAFCFLTAYVPLIAVSQIPVWAVNVSILKDAADIGWRPEQGFAKMQAFVDAIGTYGVLRLSAAFLAATVLWTLFLAAVFEAFRTLHRLGKGTALIAFGCGMVAIVAFVSFVVGPYFGTVYSLRSE